MSVGTCGSYAICGHMWNICSLHDGNDLQDGNDPKHARVTISRDSRGSLDTRDSFGSLVSPDSLESVDSRSLQML